jgi:hypothetical protein
MRARPGRLLGCLAGAVLAAGPAVARTRIGEIRHVQVTGPAPCLGGSQVEAGGERREAPPRQMLVAGQQRIGLADRRSRRLLPFQRCGCPVSSRNRWSGRSCSPGSDMDRAGGRPGRAAR